MNQINALFTNRSSDRKELNLDTIPVHILNKRLDCVNIEFIDEKESALKYYIHIAISVRIFTLLLFL